jgi:hypothetical protein
VSSSASLGSVFSRNPGGPLRTHNKISIRYCPLNKHRRGCSVIILSDKYHLSLPAGIPFVASRRRRGGDQCSFIQC